VAVHPQFQALLDATAAAVASAKPAAEQTLAERRAGMRALVPAAPDIAVGRVEDRRIPGPAGEIPVRIYWPAGRGPFPILLNFHAGGWTTGDLDTCDAQCRTLCRMAECIVVSVDYRLAPEHRFPAAVEDSYAATCWVAANAASLNGDARRLAVGGDSAGGNLATVVSLIARDRKGPPIVFQLMIYPALDCRFDTPSYRANGSGYLLTTETMVWFWDNYCPDVSKRTHPHASPLRAPDLRGLPPALIVTAEFDPLRDEGEAYAQALRAAGVATELRRFDGMIHMFTALAHVIPAGRVGLDYSAAALRRVFAG
jgi:acetyl esterase